MNVASPVPAAESRLWRPWHLAVRCLAQEVTCFTVSHSSLISTSHVMTPCYMGIRRSSPAMCLGRHCYTHNDYRAQNPPVLMFVCPSCRHPQDTWFHVVVIHAPTLHCHPSSSLICSGAGAPVIT